VTLSVLGPGGTLKRKIIFTNRITQLSGLCLLFLRSSLNSILSLDDKKGKMLHVYNYNESSLSRNLVKNNVTMKVKDRMYDR
jgi:hypothetical protein